MVKRLRWKSVSGRCSRSGHRLYWCLPPFFSVPAGECRQDDDRFPPNSFQLSLPNRRKKFWEELIATDRIENEKNIIKGYTDSKVISQASLFFLEWRQVEVDRRFEKTHCLQITLRPIPQASTPPWDPQIQRQREHYLPMELLQPSQHVTGRNPAPVESSSLPHSIFPCVHFNIILPPT